MSSSSVTNPGDNNPIRPQNNPAITTLSEFLLQAHTQHMVLDMGRGLRLINNQEFFEWENQQAPCRYPRRDHAWFCIAFWNEKLSSERYIWFIKLPLDENGLMMQAPRNQFLEIIVQALGKGLEHRTDENAQLPENPFLFTPNQQQLADCNAHIKKHLNLHDDSSLSLLNYLSAPSVQEWQNIKLQDIANFVSISNKEQQAVIASNLAMYPQAVTSSLMASFEAIELSAELTQAIINYYNEVKEPSMKALCLRAMSFKPSTLCTEFLHQLISADCALDMESLVVISGRFWPLLIDPNILLAYAHKLAKIDHDYRFFSAVFADLVKVPQTRQSMLLLLRNPNRSNEVAGAIGHLFTTTQNN